MERKLKFKVGDKVKVIASEKQLKSIGILFPRNSKDDFYYIKKTNLHKVGFLPYTLSNGYHLPEEYLDYAD